MEADEELETSGETRLVHFPGATEEIGARVLFPVFPPPLSPAPYVRLFVFFHSAGIQRMPLRVASTTYQEHVEPGAMS